MSGGTSPPGRRQLRYAFAEPAADQVYVYDFGLSADGKRLAAITQTANRAGLPGAGGGGPGGFGREVATLTVWDVATTERLESREVDSPAYMGYGAFAPDLRWYFHGDRAFAFAGNKEFKLDLPKGWSSAHQAAVSPDGRLVAQLVDQKIGETLDSRVVIHETVTGKPILTLPTGYCGPIAFSSDGRSLIVSDTKSITVWDLASQKPVVSHKSPGRFNGSYGGSFASSLTVTPDGTKAVTGQSDTTALVWNLASPPRRLREMTEKEMASSWDELAGADAEKAHSAVRALGDAGDGAVRFISPRLKPAVAPAEDRVRKLIAQLGAEEFADREAADRELRDLGELVVPSLRLAAKGGLSDEQLRRVSPILSATEAPILQPGDRLRAVRAVAVLELIGTKDAADLLDRLAAGLADTRLTREAKAASERAERKPR